MKVTNCDIQRNPDLSIIVPSYNAASFLDRCLDALLVHSRYRASEVIVVDDGSTDQSVMAATRQGVEVIVVGSNVGPGAARNLGAARAHGDIFVFVDADVAVAPDALERVAAHFMSNSPCVAVIGSYDSDPEGHCLTSKYRNLLHCYVHQNSPKRASHFWAGIGAIRKKAFATAGGFDEGEFSRACEDVELGYRLRDMGHCIRLDPSIQGKHLKRWSCLEMLRTDLFVRAIPWTHLLLTRREAPRDFSLGWGQRASVIVAWLLPLLLLLGVSGQSHALVATLLLLIEFVWINAGFFRFLREREGWALALAAVPLHWLYHFNSGLGFVLGVISHLRPSLKPLLWSSPGAGNAGRIPGGYHAEGDEKV